MMFRTCAGDNSFYHKYDVITLMARSAYEPNVAGETDIN